MNVSEDELMAFRLACWVGACLGFQPGVPCGAPVVLPGLICAVARHSRDPLCFLVASTS